MSWRLGDRDRENVTAVPNYAISLHSLPRLHDSLNFQYLCLCLLSPPLITLSWTAGACFIFCISTYRLFILIWYLHSSPLSSWVPVILTESLQSVANRTHVNLAPTHKQKAAHPPHQPTSVPATQNTHFRGRRCMAECTHRTCIWLRFYTNLVCVSLTLNKLWKPREEFCPSFLRYDMTGN